MNQPNQQTQSKQPKKKVSVTKTAKLFYKLDKIIAGHDFSGLNYKQLVNEGRTR